MKPIAVIPITKVDEARREVWGDAALEQVDKVSEIMDYDGSKPLFEAWSKNASKTSGGKSLGNLRAMHINISAGKLISFNPDDAEKRFKIGAKVVDDNEWNKVLEGVYTGFSIGGSYVKRWADPDMEGVTRYIAKPAEVSLVDNPCMPDATFEIIRSTGASELRKFAPKMTLSQADVNRIAKAVAATTIPIEKVDGKTKKVAGFDLPASAFLFVGDAEKTETWKLPVDFPDDEATKTHLRDAMSRFNQTEDIPAEKKHTIAQELITKAKAHGIEVKTFATDHVKAEFGLALKKREGDKLTKSLWDVSCLADSLQSMCYLQARLASNAEYDGLDSTLHDDLHGALLTLKQIFIDLATEQINLLIREKEAAAKLAKTSPKTVTEIPIRKGVALVVTQIDKLKKNIEACKDNPEGLAKYVGLLLKAADHIGKMSDHFDKAMAVHGKMAKNVDGMMEHCDKAMAPLHKHVTEMKDHHVALGKELDKVGDSLEDVKAATESEDEAGLDAASRKAEGAKELRKMKTEFEVMMDDMRKKHEADMLGLVSGFEKLLGAPDSPVNDTVPTRTGIAVNKTDDGSARGVGGTDVPTPAKAAAAKTEAGISATLPSGKPNPEYIKSLAGSDGTEHFVKAAGKVPMKVGDPFPSKEAA